mgnify:FL=1
MVDIDQTICEYSDKTNIYSEAIPIKENINKINKFYDEKNYIVYYSSRGGTTNLDWYELTKSQLDKWGCKYHELRLDKPHYDLIIDDKSKRIEEI